ncbi:MAG: hypothetical protein QMB42_01860 [SAR324 cluster bacterium]|jgi:hypothetical protein
MEQKFPRKNTLFPVAVLLLGILGILFSLTACKTIDIKDKADLLPYMNKPVAFMTVKPPKNLEKVWPEMMERIEQRLRELPTLGKVTGIKERKLKFVKNPKLRSQFSTYLSTLRLTGISDKEIAWKLEKELESPYFMLLDLVSFPCTKDCSANEQWVIRLKLIEAHTGDLIFLVRKQHELAEDEKVAESYNALALKLTTEVVDEFASGFIVLWHRWRYEHLRPASVRINRSELGI